MLAQLDPIHLRHDEIQDQIVRSFSTDLINGLHPIKGGENLVSSSFEGLLEQRNQELIIIGNQNLARHYTILLAPEAPSPGSDQVVASPLNRRAPTLSWWKVGRIVRPSGRHLQDPCRGDTWPSSLLCISVEKDEDRHCLLRSGVRREGLCIVVPPLGSKSDASRRKT